MDKLFDFLADNYIIFIIISGVLIFALIGFIVMGKKKEKATDDNKQETPVNNNQTVGESAQSVIPQPEEAPMSVPPVEGTVESPNLQVTEETQTTEAPTLVIDTPEVQTPVVESQPIAMETQMPMQDATLMPETPVVPEVPVDGMQETQAPDAPTLIIEDPSASVSPVEPQTVDTAPIAMETQMPMQDAIAVPETPIMSEAPTEVVQPTVPLEVAQPTVTLEVAQPTVPLQGVQPTVPLQGVQPVGQTSIFETTTDANQNNVQ